MVAALEKQGSLEIICLKSPIFGLFYDFMGKCSRVMNRLFGNFVKYEKISLSLWSVVILKYPKRVYGFFYLAAAVFYFTIRNMDLINRSEEKLAPTVKLTDKQAKLIEQIISFIRRHEKHDFPAVFVLSGDAGSGKSVVLSHLFFRLQQAAREKFGSLAGSRNYFLVNHPELLKVYRNIAGHYPQLLKKDFQRPTTFINRLSKEGRTADAVIIDEAHLLLSRSDPYNNFTADNQLAEILKLAKVIVLVFDSRQVIKTKDYWTERRLLDVISAYPKQVVHLKEQFRMQAGSDLLDWINSFTKDRRLLPIQADFRQGFDFRIFADAEQMREMIVAKNQLVGLSRIVSTTGYASLLDGEKHYIQEGDFCMPWDQYNYQSIPWAEIPETVNEVGSVYTCQGFDLNYVGLILGPPIYLQEQNHIAVDLTKVTSKEAFQQRKDLVDQQAFQRVKESLVLNTVNILMKRGIKGLYIFAHDQTLRQRLIADYDRSVADV